MPSQVVPPENARDDHTAIVLRDEETLIGSLEQLTAMVAQNARFLDRLRSVAKRSGRLEELEQ